MGPSLRPQRPLDSRPGLGIGPPPGLDEPLAGPGVPGDCVGSALFPLPMLPLVGGTRSQRKRHAVERHVVVDTNSILAAVIWLAGASWQSPSRVSNGPMQAEVTARVRRLVESRRPSSEAPPAETALMKLLRGHSPYASEGAGSRLTAIKAQLLSLPDNPDGGCPPALGC